MFINACFACTRQAEFYSGAADQAVSISFLHEYILGNYRRVYARCLAAGINHFNQSLIITNLLAAGAPVDDEQRREEGQLIGAALLRLPANRAFRLIRGLQERRVNNRRTRAVIRRFLERRPDTHFDAVKYRVKYRAAAQHAHLNLQSELSRFLFALDRSPQKFETPLLETYRQAKYSHTALYELPFTVAEGFAAQHGIPRDTFLKRIEPRMTEAERLRLQSAAAREKKVEIRIDLGRTPLTRLALYVLSLPVAERRKRLSELHAAMTSAAHRALQSAPLELNRVVAILDASYSASGSTEKRRRPLAVALASSYLLRAAAREYHAIWIPRAGATHHPSVAQQVTERHELLVESRGQTALAEPLIDALENHPDLVVIVSDGFENDPPGAASDIARVFHERLDPDGRTDIVHLNPVFDSDNFQPHVLSDVFPTVGLRDAEDIPTMLGFARFASGSVPLTYLEAYLSVRTNSLLSTRS